MKPISGAWFEFAHHSIIEGRLYNDALRSFTADQWAAMIRDARALGMDTLVLTFSSIVYRDKSGRFPPADVVSPGGIAC